MKRVAIIGTAGRKRMPERRHERYMLDAAREFLRGREGSTLVSGGAAWADHVAVRLALEDGWPLSLHLPAEFDHVCKRYTSEGWHSPGSVSNIWHRKFSEVARRDALASLREIAEVLRLPTTSVPVAGRGFWFRNRTIAESEDILAFTFGATEPIDGGTRQTWDMARELGAALHHVGLS